MALASGKLGSCHSDHTYGFSLDPRGPKILATKCDNSQLLYIIHLYLLFSLEEWQEMMSAC